VYREAVKSGVGGTLDLIRRKLRLRRGLAAESW
jgi:hypothetical protein